MRLEQLLAVLEYFKSRNIVIPSTQSLALEIHRSAIIVFSISVTAISHNTLKSTGSFKLYCMLSSTRLGINVVYSSSYSSTNSPQLQSPYLICGFPGTGYIGKIAVDHLIEELHAKHLADIYSSSFPPQILIRTDGVAELMKNSIYYSDRATAVAANTTSSSSNDMLLLTGDSQPVSPESQYLLAEEILDIAAKFNIQKIFTLGAYITQVFVDKPRVFGTANDIEIVKAFDGQNILTMDNGSVAGMNGLIVGIAKLRGIKGICLLGETSGYVVDAKSSKVVLESLLSITGIRVDMTDIEKKAKDTEMLIETIKQEAAGRALENQQPNMPSKPANTTYIS
jgi:uncharacterized protein